MILYCLKSAVVRTFLTLSRNIRSYRGEPIHKCQGYSTDSPLDTRRPQVTKLFRKKNTRKINSSSYPLEDAWITKSFQSSVIAHQFVDECRLNGFCPMTRCPGLPATMRQPMISLVSNWRWYVQAKDTDKGGPVKRSGGGIGKLSDANEGGFFHKLNLARLKQVKKRLNKNKALNLEGPEEPKSGK